MLPRVREQDAQNHATQDAVIFRPNGGPRENSSWRDEAREERPSKPPALQDFERACPLLPAIQFHPPELRGCSEFASQGRQGHGGGKAEIGGEDGGVPSRGAHEVVATRSAWAATAS